MRQTLSRSPSPPSVPLPLPVSEEATRNAKGIPRRDSRGIFKQPRHSRSRPSNLGMSVIFERSRPGCNTPFSAQQFANPLSPQLSNGIPISSLDISCPVVIKISRNFPSLVSSRSYTFPLSQINNLNPSSNDHGKLIFRFRSLLIFYPTIFKAMRNDFKNFVL